jgi:division protein CdvB (Snf7/Vps24/ESCRT-III family)
MEDLKRLRKAGLEQGGEQSVENLAFKLLRARGQIDKLRKYINKLTSAELSLGEQHEDQ